MTGLRLPTLAQMRAVAALLRIPLKDGAVGAWTLNRSQERLAGALAEGKSVIVLKLRQEGITSVCLLWLMLLAVINPGLSFLIVLHDDESAKDKLAILRDWLGQVGVKPDMAQAHKLRLPNGAEVHAKTSHSGEAEGNEARKGRSGTYAAALLSEAAYYRNDKALGAIKAAVGRGPIVLESTASGPHGFFATLWHDEAAPYEKVFLSVEDSDRCRMPEDTITDEEWARLQTEHGFKSREHAAFWSHELRAVGGDVLSMLREYPVKPEDPFRASEGAWVAKVPKVLDPLRVTSTGVHIYAEPNLDRRQKRYVLTQDVGEGVGGDWTPLFVLDRETHDIVAGWWSNTTPTDEAAQVVRWLFEQYRPDACLVERNGVGVSAIKEARRLNVPVVEVWATEPEKYAKLLAAKRYLEERERVPEILVEESESLRVRLTRRNRYQWIGRKDGMIALGQALEWLRLSPWKPEPVMSEEERYFAASAASA